MIVCFPFSLERLVKIRSIPGRAWHQDQKYWTVPRTPAVLEQLRTVFASDGVEVDHSLEPASQSNGNSREPQRPETTFLGKAPVSDPSCLVPEPDDSVERIVQATLEAVQVRHLSPRTGQAYSVWIRRFGEFHSRQSLRELGEPAINEYLSHLAVVDHVSASPQNQALAALLFCYRHVLCEDVGDLGAVVRAKRPTRLPVVMTRDEVKSVLRLMRGDKWLASSLMYGSGLRLVECLELRVQDLDFAQRRIVVRSGKGDKDRITMLAESLADPLKRHLQEVKQVHEADVRAGWGRVALPEALERKFPNAPSDWRWQ